MDEMARRELDLLERQLERMRGMLRSPVPPAPETHAPAARSAESMEAPKS